MKRGLVFIIFLLCILTVSAALSGDMSNSKYSSDIFKIKFDDHPDFISYNQSGVYKYGCSPDGRLFLSFDATSDSLTTDKIKLSYKIFEVPGTEKELTGKYYRRNLQTGIFEEISGTRLSNMVTYYFWSDTLFDDNNYIITEKNIEGADRERTFYIHCPKFQYTCEDFKPVANCYNTNDEKLVIEFSGINIRGNETFGISDLFIHTKGTNEKSNVLDNTLSTNAVMEKIGNDKYRIISSLLYGDPQAGTNIINYVYFEPKICFYDLYPDAYISPKCDGIKNISSSELLAENQISGAAVAETGIGNNYLIYGLGLLVLVVIVVLLFRKKKMFYEFQERKQEGLQSNEIQNRYFSDQE